MALLHGGVDWSAVVFLVRLWFFMIIHTCFLERTTVVVTGLLVHLSASEYPDFSLKKPCCKTFCERMEECAMPNIGCTCHTYKFRTVLACTLLYLNQKVPFVEFYKFYLRNFQLQLSSILHCRVILRSSKLNPTQYTLS